MAEPAPTDIAARLRELERQVRELRERVAFLERNLAPRNENPVDRATVREKAVYDWQS